MGSQPPRRIRAIWIVVVPALTAVGVFVVPSLIPGLVGPLRLDADDRIVIAAVVLMAVYMPVLFVMALAANRRLDRYVSREFDGLGLKGTYGRTYGSFGGRWSSRMAHALVLGPQRYRPGQIHLWLSTSLNARLSVIASDIDPKENVGLALRGVEYLSWFSFLGKPAPDIAELQAGLVRLEGEVPGLEGLHLYAPDADWAGQVVVDSRVQIAIQALLAGPIHVHSMAISLVPGWAIVSHRGSTWERITRENLTTEYSQLQELLEALEALEPPEIAAEQTAWDRMAVENLESGQSRSLTPPYVMLAGALMFQIVVSSLLLWAI